MKWKNDIGVSARKSAIEGTALALLLFALSGAVLKFLISDAKNWNATGVVKDAIRLAFAGVGLLFGWEAYKMLSDYLPRLINIEETPAIAQLARFGVPIVVARTIHDEIQHASRELSLGYFSTLIITPNWMVYTTFGHVDVCKINEFHSLHLKFSAQDAKIAESVVLEAEGWSLNVHGSHDKCLLIVREIKSRHASIKVPEFN